MDTVFDNLFNIPRVAWMVCRWEISAVYVLFVDLIKLTWLDLHFLLVMVYRPEVTLKK